MIYLFLIGSYLIGSLSFAVIISKFYKINDPRTYGSKNAGATNVMRSGNKKAAILTLLGDLLKGVIVVWIAKYYFALIDGGEAVVALCGILAVIGHIYPIFFKFKGGKGVATAIGVILGFNPILAVLLFITWLIIFKISKISSLSALFVSIISPIYAYFLMGNNSYFGATLIITFFILYTHKSNIYRLITKQEHKFTKPKSKTDN
ncbi:MAG: glycerol-3-phosphate 1-O-acyltransferase PlsY [Burkholderiales bacterium]|nr:glycerol-3-phosphate 1-O-acyltransferase PlsY [Burkholderiales bacterium]